MKKQDIVIIDYGMGNLRSVEKAFQYTGLSARIISDSRELKTADKIVLPGVGAMQDAYSELKRNNFIEPLIENITINKKPFLGICLGFQLLFDSSEESGGVQGLGIIPGRVVRFNIKEKVPQIGWNTIKIIQKHDLFEKVGSGSYVYFVHSYYAIPEEEKVTATITTYGIPFTSAICHNNITATQFHPEKSQKPGLQIIKNFGKL